MTFSQNREAISFILKKLQHQKSHSEHWNISWRLGLLLKELVSINSPKQILEIGTSNGFSTLWMALALDDMSHITTLEINEERYESSKNNFKEAKIDSNITSLLGNCLDLIPQLDGNFDFIFLDAAHQSYEEIVHLLLDNNLLSKGGVLICDNVISHSYMKSFISEITPFFSSFELINLDSGFLVLTF